jgi:thioredoxin 2
MKQFVCPACGAVNRAPEGRDARVANCGKCHQDLLTGAPIEVSGAQLQSHRQGTKGAALLLDVWAPWCGPCKSMGPQFALAAKELEPYVRLLKLNSEAEPAAASAAARVESRDSAHECCAGFQPSHTKPPKNLTA